MGSVTKMNTPSLNSLETLLKKTLNSAKGTIILVVLLVIGLIYTTCFTYIKPYEYGIKQVNIGFKRGIQKKTYETGLHFIMPFGFEKMHRFPKKLQIFDLSNAVNKTTSKFKDKAANIQTSDGFYVEVDVSIIFKIQNPYQVLTTIGPGNLFFLNAVLPKSEPALKETLGTLTTEEFYNPYLRSERMLLAKNLLSKELEKKGVSVEEILIRYFRYSPEIQRNIEEKKLKDQLVFKNKAEARTAIEGAKLSKTIKEGEAIVKIELEKGKAYVQVKNAEKELYVRRKKAAANLLVKKAEAEKVRLKNNALKGMGSENLIGLEMAKVLEGIELIILPTGGKNGINPLDLEKTRMLFD